jgi:hypothetical protein
VLEFHLELTCTPSGVSGEDSEFGDPFDVRRVEGDVDEAHGVHDRSPVPVGLHVRPLCDADRCLWLDRAALEDESWLGQLFVPGRQMIYGGQLEGPVEHDPHRSVFVVIEEKNDGTEEIGIGENR